ncbi:WecB/TagA/CpsF family glycosyltransferase [Pseudohongiella nitratireducens]|uniref:WecB/TagA/CpsF family glycosyltransferase n=1 Tax=Pseudohongiella nitratireducens TaxID=1768907 RepID=UPI0030ED722B
MKDIILGYGVDTFGVDECCDLIFSSLQAPGKRWMACFNPHSYAESFDDKHFASALRDADWLVPDGIGVVLASRMLGGSIVDRVTGSDVFYGLMERMNALGGMTVFFLGATENTLTLIRERLARDYPCIELAGTYSPPFKPEYTQAELDEMTAVINAVKPDVLWVGMTAPKQEKWILDNLPLLDVKFAGAIGAVFDFYTGRVKRSHPVFQRLGLEWLPRLLQQPRRLWRRMFISAPIFVMHVFKQKLTE